jgi:hypothetical protein
MRNSPRLPAVALGVSLVLVIHLAITSGRRDGPLEELGLGELAVALALALFGVQGLISVAVEGQELRPGRIPERLTNPLSVAIVLLSVILFAVSVALARGIVDEWSIRAIGSLAGAGCLILSALLILYKEAFVGDEASFDTRQDGVPW